MNRINTGMTTLTQTLCGCMLTASGFIAICPVGADATQTAATYTIAGEVVDASVQTSRVAGAHVTLSSGQPAAALTVATDAAGRFVFPDVRAGRYRIDVRADGYLPSGFGKRWPGGPTMEVEAGEGAPLTIWAWRESSVSGRLTSTDGRSLRGTRVTIFRPSWFARDSITSLRTAVTDDDGNYRFEHLEPGRYVVGSVQRYSPDVGCRRAYQNEQFQCQPWPADGSLPPRKSETGEHLIYESTFYSSSSDVTGAAEITLRAGDNRIGIDLVLPLRRGHVIYGQIVGPDGPLGQTEISLVKRSNAVSAATIEPVESTTTTEPDGRFVLIGVVAGDYELRARYLPRTGPDIEYRLSNGIIGGSTGGISAVSAATPVLEAAVPLEVNEANEQRIAVELRRASNLTLKLRYVSDVRGQSGRPAAGAEVRLLPLVKEVHALTGTLNDNYSVEFPSVSTARYRIVVPPHKGWWISRIDGAPAEGLEEPLISIRCCDSYVVTIELTDRLATLTGDVRDAKGLTVAASDIVIFPSAQGAAATRDLERFKWVRARNGKFDLSNVPPGDYFVVALPDTVWPFDWRDPEVIRSLTPLGAPVTIKQGQAHSVTVTRSQR